MYSNFTIVQGKEKIVAYERRKKTIIFSMHLGAMQSLYMQWNKYCRKLTFIVGWALYPLLNKKKYKKNIQNFAVYIIGHGLSLFLHPTSGKCNVLVPDDNIFFCYGFFSVFLI